LSFKLSNFKLKKREIRSPLSYCLVAIKTGEDYSRDFAQCSYQHVPQSLCGWVSPFRALHIPVHQLHFPGTSADNTEISLPVRGAAGVRGRRLAGCWCPSALVPEGVWERAEIWLCALLQSWNSVHYRRFFVVKVSYHLALSSLCLQPLVFARIWNACHWWLCLEFLMLYGLGTNVLRCRLHHYLRLVLERTITRTTPDIFLEIPENNYNNLLTHIHCTNSVV
jgi:hypothetical protein